MKDLTTIETFIQKRHILTLSTQADTEVESCSAFYAYEPLLHSFVIASDEKTNHIQNALQNPKVALNIFLDTKEVGRIEGVQIKATLHPLQNATLKQSYFKRFPYAVAMQPTLWEIKPYWMKYTSNRLGFGKKLIVEL